MPRAQLLPAEAVALRGVRPPRLDDDVGACDQPQQRVLAAVVGEVESERALRAVRSEEHDAAAGEEPWPPLPCFVASPRVLDLHDLGPEPAEDLGAGRPGKRRGEVDDTNPVQRLEAHAFEATHRIARRTRTRCPANPGGEMKLGMNMLRWSTDVTGAEYLPVFEQLRDLGYEGIEVPIFDTSPPSVEGYGGL